MFDLGLSVWALALFLSTASAAPAALPATAPAVDCIPDTQLVAADNLQPIPTRPPKAQKRTTCCEQPGSGCVTCNDSSQFCFCENQREECYCNCRALPPYEEMLCIEDCFCQGELCNGGFCV